MIVVKPVATIMPALQRLVWLVMIHYVISDLLFLANFCSNFSLTIVMLLLCIVHLCLQVLSSTASNKQVNETVGCSVDYNV